MKTIEFRAFYEGEYIYSTDTIVINTKDQLWQFFKRINGKTIIEQFTGLFDKNDVKIFEGDKVMKGDSVEKIEYSKDRFRVTNFDGGIDDLFLLVNQGLIEVIQ